MRRAVLLFILCLQSAVAHEETREPVIRVTGSAVVMAQPDQARIDLGVVTEANTAAMAANQNAQRLDKVLAELKKAFGASATINTVSYSLNPIYRYPEKDGKPEVIGYTAANIVRVTLDKVSDAGKAIDAATSAGANRVERLEFGLKDEQATQSTALREAAANAQAKAATLADSLALEITGVLSVAENQAPIVFPQRRQLALAEASATPIEPGTIEVRAEVVLEVAVQAR